MKMNIAVVPALVLAAMSAQAQGQTNPPAKPPAAAQVAGSAASSGTAAIPTRIGLMNVRDAIMETADGKKAALDLEEKFASRRTTLQKRQIDLQAKKDQMSRGGAAMSEAAKAALAREIDAEDKNFKRDVEDLNTDGEEAQNKLFQAIWAKLQPVVQQYALQNGFAAILDVGNDQTPVLWASNTMFITADVVSLYNQSHVPAATATPAASKPAAPATLKPAATPAQAPAATPAQAPAPPPTKKP
jgi:Skp family chaperone for outer membrane proteins